MRTLVEAAQRNLVEGNGNILLMSSHDINQTSGTTVAININQ